MRRLGKLHRVEPRSVWDHEARDFTPWLRKNIDLLSEAVGLELDLVTTEEPVGGFAVDLYAKDMNSGRWVIIENQLERTDHSHLGQLLTYAAGKEAGVVIWISPEFRDEHRKTLDWLNEITHDEVSFFAIQLELLQIDQSDPAPYLRLVAEPSEWPPEPPAPGVTERQKKYQAFFESLLDEVKSRYPGLTRATKAYPQSWFTFPVGRSGFAISTAFSQERELTVQLYIDGGDAAKSKAAYDALLEDSAAIEDQLGTALEWRRLDDKQASIIQVGRSGSIDDDQAHLSDLLAWAAEMVGKFHRVFKPRVQRLRL